MVSFGIELGIRAPLEAVQKAALISDSWVEYYFVPETHPRMGGVDALFSIDSIADKITKTKVGTGIVNVFSRTPEDMGRAAARLYEKLDGRFVLGIGVSAPIVVEGMFGEKFEKPLSRMVEYTNSMKSYRSNHWFYKVFENLSRMVGYKSFPKPFYTGPVYWAAVGDKTLAMSADKADGCMFFLRPASETKRAVELVRERLAGKKTDFNTVVIRPTYVSDTWRAGAEMARMTIASYLGANEFYGPPIERTGLVEELMDIRASMRYGVREAAKHVSDRMVRELATVGTPKECASELADHAYSSGARTVVAGFDLPSKKYDREFFENLHKLVSKL